MESKIVGICICTLLIATSVPEVSSMNNRKITMMVESSDIQSLTQADWKEIQKLLASDGATEDQFGRSVSISGDYAVIGAHLDDLCGSAYVFKRSGTNWSQEAKINASDGAADDHFGQSVSIYGDYALIGALGDDSRRGSAYVFKRSGTSWLEETKLLASDGAANDQFGRSVSISGDYAVIGAHLDDLCGSAYVFKRSGTNWSQEAKINASDGAAGDLFGWSVSIYGDYAVIGAPIDNGRGSAYVFKRSGTSWLEEAKLLASDGAADDEFGISVSIYGDYALIGALYDDSRRGSAYVFKRSGTSWLEEAKLLASDGAAGDWFGVSVSIYGDYAVIGAPLDDSGRGSAYVFKRSGTSWLEETKLVASDGTVSDEFGWSVSISGDYAVIGAWGDDWERGSTYVFIKNKPPNKPAKPKGKANGRVNIEYTYNTNTTDPNLNQIYYWFDWGDGNNSGWVGPYDSGATATANYTWTIKGIYQIKVKAKNVWGAESVWSDPLLVTMPKNKVFNFNLNLLGWFFERYPNVFPILRHLRELY